MSVPDRIGRYRLLDEIGRGAMGRVYRAHDPQLQRDVAIKLISLALAAGHGDPQEAAARFAREARVAARLQHPHVVAVYDAGEEGDQLYLVMELVAGETLAHRLSRADFPGTVAALEIVAQTADALAAAHLAGVIHRDVKPGNLLLTPSGFVKVSDFGVAKAVGESTELTRTGMMVGSPAYMAPEQVQGLELDGRSDLFSVGVVLYEMLLHRKPFPADTLTTLVYQILHQDPFESETVASRLHPDLADLLRWCLAKERELRVPDAQTLAVRARALAAQFARPGAASLTGPTVVAIAGGARARESSPLPPPSYATSAPTEIVARPRGGGGPGWRRWALGAGLALLLAAVAIGLLMRRPAPPPDLAHAPAGTAVETAAAAGASTTVAPPPSPASPASMGETVAQPEGKPALAAGQRSEQTPAPLPAKSRPSTQSTSAPDAGASTRSSADSAPVESAPVSAPPVALPASEPPPIAGVFQCRKGAEFHVDPEEVLVTIDGKLLGTADDWDGTGGGKTYYFPGPGEYLVKLSLEGFRTVWVKIVVTPAARHDVVNVDNELEEIN